MAVCNLSIQVYGQEARLAVPAPVTKDSAAANLPEAPVPQIELAHLDQQPTAATSSASSDSQQPGSTPSPVSSSSSSQSTNGAAQSSSSSQTPPAPLSPQQSQHDKAAEQIKEQEHQRIGGILPSFNVTYRSDAASMTAGQKISLAFHSAVDPYAFGLSFVVAGFSEARDDDNGFGWGPEGYFKRAGAAYLDAFDGAMIGNGILPSLLHQDPRYFRLGHGTFRHRFFYALATSYICKHDNTHKWEPNYSNVGGNIIAGAISNLYYPSNTSGWEQTIDNGLIVTTEGTFGGVLQEFWPDISRKLFHKDPTNGLDAQARAADAAAKQKKQQ